MNTTHIHIGAQYNNIYIVLPTCVLETLNYPREIVINERAHTLRAAGVLESGRIVRPVNGNKLVWFRPVYHTPEYFTGNWTYEIKGDTIILIEKLR